MGRSMGFPSVRGLSRWGGGNEPVALPPREDYKSAFVIFVHLQPLYSFSYSSLKKKKGVPGFDQKQSRNENEKRSLDIFKKGEEIG